ncbi:class I SAM-dependent methyltransferase [Streptomyces abikoensis]|uniref:class I SAM-dependent methyltransferase n=1 Tax=Streptomyces abikoensis TaxID=97398 RepID=UPI0036916DAD
MPMNLVHRRLCSSEKWARAVEDRLLPWVLDGVPLGPDALEIGPGYGATTRVLLRREGLTRLSVVEVDAAYAAGLRREFGDRAEGVLPGEGGAEVEVVHGDGTALPWPDGRFDSVACFTMLHHVPSPARQDALFAEAHRVLRPGGVFAGCDSLSNWRWRLIHWGDTCVPVPPATLETRLRAAGFTEVAVEVGTGSFRFRAVRAVPVG